MGQYNQASSSSTRDGKAARVPSATTETYPEA